MKTVRVAAAVIHSEGRIFATQRGYGPFKGGWEFPGGKIEPGETPQEALVREIREELDCSIAVERGLGRVEYDYPDFHLSMDLFLCSLAQGHMTLREHAAARWLEKEELSQVDWLPADRSFVESLAQGLPQILKDKA